MNIQQVHSPRGTPYLIDMDELQKNKNTLTPFYVKLYYVGPTTGEYISRGFKARIDQIEPLIMYQDTSNVAETRNERATKSFDDTYKITPDEIAVLIKSGMIKYHPKYKQL